MNDRWERVVEVFDSAVDRDATERASFVHQACTGDDDFRRQVELLLAEADRPEPPVLIDRPIGEIVAICWSIIMLSWWGHSMGRIGSNRCSASAAWAKCIGQ